MTIILYLTNSNKESCPTAERSKSSDLDRGWGDPNLNPGEGCCRDIKRSIHHIACLCSWLKLIGLQNMIFLVIHESCLVQQYYQLGRSVTHNEKKRTHSKLPATVGLYIYSLQSILLHALLPPKIYFICRYL